MFNVFYIVVIYIVGFILYLLKDNYKYNYIILCNVCICFVDFVYLQVKKEKKFIEFVFQDGFFNNLNYLDWGVVGQLYLFLCSNMVFQNYIYVYILYVICICLF